MRKSVLDLSFVVISIVYKYHKIWLRQNFKLENGNEKFSIFFPFVKGHNSRTVKVTQPIFKLDLCFVVISIMYKIHNIC